MIAVEAPGWQGASEEDTRRYLTNEQRCQPGWIAREGGRVIPTRALRQRIVIRVVVGPRRLVILDRSAVVVPVLGSPFGLGLVVVATRRVLVGTTRHETEKPEN